MATIYIDGDNCPRASDIYRHAQRAGLDVTFVHNGSGLFLGHRLPGMRIILVDSRPNEADDKIVSLITPADLCITHDIELASRCLDKGAKALSHLGIEWTAQMVGKTTSRRNNMYIAPKELGSRALKHGPVSQDNFLDMLDRLMETMKGSTPQNRKLNILSRACISKSPELPA